MRVLLLNYEYPPLGGGAANATARLLERFLLLRDIDIDVVTSSVGRARREEMGGRIRLHFLDIGKRGSLHYQTNRELLGYALQAHPLAATLARERRFDIVHAFFGIPCGHVAARLHLPYIVSLRGSDVPFYNPRFDLPDRLLFQALSRRIWRGARAVVANSTGLGALAARTAPDLAIQVIPNGVDTEAFVPTARPAPGERLVVLSTGRLIRRKGYDHLIRALAGRAGFELVLVGDGDRREELTALARDLGVRAAFLGRLEAPAVREQLARADVFVLPSLNEGMSNAVLEAMACGLPVIVTDVGGAVELVDGNGFVVPPADPAALAAALARYRGSPGLLVEHGRRSREMALRMSWDAVAAAYLDLYGRCASVSSARRPTTSLT